MAESIISSLSFIPFSKFNLWDVKRYSSNYLLQDDFVLLKDILTPYKNELSKDELKQNKWHIISKINFGGKLFLRNLEEVDTFKGNLSKVPSNSIIYSKINVRHGCVYYHPEAALPFGVSSEYPVFVFDETNVNGEFLQMTLRSQKVKDFLNTKTSGISKARVKVGEFLSIPIPLPPLTEQNRIVENYKNSIAQAIRIEQDIGEKELEINKYFFNELGVKKYRLLTKGSGLDVISFKEIERWALSHLLKQRMISFINVKYQIKPIKALLTFFDGGKTPSTNRKEFWNGDVYWASAKDMKVIFLDCIQDKITKQAVKEAGMKVYPEGTILGVFRSGILRHSFPVAITKVQTTINQDLKAMGLRKEYIVPLYFLFYLNTFQEMILERAQKSGVTVESINSEEFLEIPVILPPIETQNSIVDEVSSMKSDIENKRLQGATLRLLAIKEFENEIFKTCN